MTSGFGNPVVVIFGLTDSSASSDFRVKTAANLTSFFFGGARGFWATLVVVNFFVDDVLGRGGDLLEDALGVALGDRLDDHLGDPLGDRLGDLCLLSVSWCSALSMFRRYSASSLGILDRRPSRDRLLGDLE